LGTTALLAAGMFAGPALGQARTAMTATNFNLTLGGFTTFRFEYQSKSPAQDVTTLDGNGTLADEPRNHNLDFDAELEFRGAATLSNGVKAGWEVELEAGGGTLADCAESSGCDIIDDNFMYVDGRLGKVTLGGFSINALDVGIARTYSSASAINLNDADGNALAVAGANQASFTNTLVQNNGRNRIQYEPPAIAGFRLSLAYAPDVSMENTTAATQEDDVGAVDKDIQIGAQWAGSLMGNRLRASFGWATSNAENNDPAAVGVKNNNRWRLGADIEVLGFTIGGHYVNRIDNAAAADAGTDVNEDIARWGLGATYELGVWEFGLAYERAVQDELDATYTAVGTGEDKATRWDFGVQYTGLGGGRTILAGIRQEKWEDDMNNPDNESKTRSIDLQYNWDVAPGLELDFGYTNYRYTHHAGLDATDTQDQRTAHGLKIQTKLTF
jgi:predicted porin